jgi:hypothetical protein
VGVLFRDGELVRGGVSETPADFLRGLLGEIRGMVTMSSFLPYSHSFNLLTRMLD